MSLNTQEVTDTVISIVSKNLNIDNSYMDYNAPLEEYGMNSILALRIYGEITNKYPNFENRFFRSINQIITEIVENK